MAHERLRFDPPPPEARSLPNALRDPLRAAILAAVVVTVLGAMLPFMRIFRPGTGWFDITGFEQTGDGGFVLELAIVAGVIVWIDGAWNSRILALVAGPAVLGAASVLILRDFYQTGIVYLDGLKGSGGHGGFEPGFWMAVAGAVALTVTGSLAIWRARGRLSFRPGATVTSVAGIAGGVVGAILGFVVGSTIAPMLVRGTIGQSSTVAVIAAIALAFLGAWFGAIAASSAARGLAGR
jgi:hypothetical protein